VSFRIRRGRGSFSLGPRGPRANVRIGCALPLLVAIAIAAAVAIR
jgi:hypothetical protein